jgi:hypothetical protein
MLVRSLVTATARLAFVVFVIAGFSTAAQAEFVTFVSNTGVDARPCTLQAQPCKTLQRAVAATSGGGTVRILSDLDGQPAITIGKSLTVEGGGNSVIGTITINSGSAVVTLRGLHLTAHRALASGIVISSAAAVSIEDCTVERYTSDGMKLVTTTGTKLFVVNTASHDNGSDGLYVDAVNAQAVIQNSRFEANASTGLFLKVKRATVLQSVALGNGQAGIILNAGLASFTETTAANNGNNGFNIDGGGAMMTSSVAHGNTGWGLHITLGATAMITNCVISQNSTGIYNDGTLNTFRNNELIRNNSFAYQGSGGKQDETAF